MAGLLTIAFVAWVTTAVSSNSIAHTDAKDAVGVSVSKLKMRQKKIVDAHRELALSRVGTHGALAQNQQNMV